MEAAGFDDSKALSEQERERLFHRMEEVRRCVLMCICVICVYVACSVYSTFPCGKAADSNAFMLVVGADGEFGVDH